MPPVFLIANGPPATVCAPLVVSLTVKPNQPEDDGEYGVPDVALPNAALPIARGQRGCLTENPQYAHPLVSSVSVILPNFLCELQT